MSNSAYWIGGTIPWLSSSDVRQAWINDASAQITELAVAETSVPLIPPNSVIVVIRSGILRRFLPVACNSRQVAINQDLRALEPGPGHHPHFLQQALIGFERRILQDCLKAGTTVESIDSAWFRGFEISLPCMDEQKAIATVLSDTDAEIAALERRRDKTKAIKQGMMQQLLTGRVRLVKPAAPAEKAQPARKPAKAPTWQISEEVLISVLAKQFGSEKFPLGRMRRMKLTYLLRRHLEGQAAGYLKKAAGPYNPKTKYGGPEMIGAPERLRPRAQVRRSSGLCRRPERRPGGDLLRPVVRPRGPRVARTVPLQDERRVGVAGDRGHGRRGIAGKGAGGLGRLGEGRDSGRPGVEAKAVARDFLRRPHCPGD